MDRYAHALPERLRAAADTMDDALGASAADDDREVNRQRHDHSDEQSDEDEDLREPLSTPNAEPERRRSDGEAPGQEGGDGGTRTPNPRLAKAVLCQLSYVPGLGTPGS
jgi:hypothetical protein